MSWLAQPGTRCVDSHTLPRTKLLQQLVRAFKMPSHHVKRALTVAEVSTKSGRTWEPRVTQHQILSHDGTTGDTGMVARCCTCVCTTTRTESGNQVRVFHALPMTSATICAWDGSLRVSDGNVESAPIGSLRANVDLSEDSPHIPDHASVPQSSSSRLTRTYL